MKYKKNKNCNYVLLYEIQKFIENIIQYCFASDYTEIAVLLLLIL